MPRDSGPLSNPLAAELALHATCFLASIMAANQSNIRIRGATAQSKRDRPSRYFVFDRTEVVRGYPRDAPGASEWLTEIPGSAAWPERLTKQVNDLASIILWTELFESSNLSCALVLQVNVLAGLELHVDVMTADEETALVKDLNALLDSGERNELPGDTFAKPPKNKEGNGRRTYATHFTQLALALPTWNLLFVISPQNAVWVRIRVPRGGRGIHPWDQTRTYCWRDATLVIQSQMHPTNIFIASKKRQTGILLNDMLSAPPLKY